MAGMLAVDLQSLSSFTDAERDLILGVIRRDEELRQRELDRIE